MLVHQSRRQQEFYQNFLRNLEIILGYNSDCQNSRTRTYSSDSSAPASRNSPLLDIGEAEKAQELAVANTTGRDLIKAAQFIAEQWDTNLKMLIKTKSDGTAWEQCKGLSTLKNQSQSC